MKKTNFNSVNINNKHMERQISTYCTYNYNGIPGCTHMLYGFPGERFYKNYYIILKTYFYINNDIMNKLENYIGENDWDEMYNIPLLV